VAAVEEPTEKGESGVLEDTGIDSVNTGHVFIFPVLPDAILVHLPDFYIQCIPVLFEVHEGDGKTTGGLYKVDVHHVELACAGIVGKQVYILLPVTIPGMYCPGVAIQAQNKWFLLEGTKHQGHAVVRLQVCSRFIAAASVILPDNTVGVDDSQAVTAFRRNIDPAISHCRAAKVNVLFVNEGSE